MSLKEYEAQGGAALTNTPDDFDQSPEQFAHVPLKLIVSSRTNPRKTFDQVKLQELADSIQASGVHMPILLRPLPADRLEETSLHAGTRPTHEIVAGERRYRASVLAGVLTVPATIRRLTDAEVVEIQVIENLQREDLSELEEAEGYEQLMQHAAINADQVAGKIGKSKSYVYARLKLLDLCQAPRQAVRDGKIDASKALLLARIPNEKLQAEALKAIMREDYYGESMSARQAADHVQRNYMLQLGKARFKITDASLLPAAGSCKECPKRTGHAPDLFTDVKGADVCTDPTCFHQKEEAHAASLVRAAKEKGQTVIAGKAAQELVTNGYQDKLKGYKRLDVSEDSPTGTPLRKIIGAQMKSEGIQPVMIEGQKNKGELVAALPNEVVARLLKTVQGQAEAAQTVSKEVRELVADKKAKADAKAEAGYEQEWRKQLLARTWAVIEEGNSLAFTLDVHRHLVAREVSRLSVDEATAAAELLGLGKVGAHSALHEFVKTTSSPDFLQLLLIMLRDAGPHDCTYIDGERVNNVGLMLIARTVFKEDLAVVTQQAQQDAKDKFFPKPLVTSKGRKKAAPAEAPKTDLPLAPAAQASTSRGKGKGEKSKGLAAPDGAKPVLKRKTTPQEAMEGIAGAMQSIEASAPADAGSTDAAPAPGDAAGDTVPGSAAALQGIEASALADAGSTSKVAWPFPGEPAPRPRAAQASEASDDTAPSDEFKNDPWPYPGTAPAPTESLLQRATDLVKREQKASQRLLKSQLSIGQAKADELLATMEKASIVSSCDERGARKVLVRA